MTAPSVCLTVDVEDFAEGMAVLGHEVPGGAAAAGGLGGFLERLQEAATRPRLTLFVVGSHAPRVRADLAAFAAAGHEIASHGPDHGRLPATGLTSWLRRGREMLEDLLQVPVLGFRSPRFDVPAAGLDRYRSELAEAGFRYVSDTSRLGERSPVAELPVLRWRGLQVGGGSYQRLLPQAVVRGALAASSPVAVLYYHSYDFDGSVPGLRAGLRSPAMAKQVVGRRRVESVFRRIVDRYGSERCIDVAG